MNFDHDFGNSFLPFLLPPKKRGKKKKRMNTKIVIKSHAFLLDQGTPPSK
jgi:hypothetical protein